MTRRIRFVQGRIIPIFVFLEFSVIILMDIVVALFGEGYRPSEKIKIHLEKEIDGLPEDQKKVLHLHFDKKNSIKEIALQLKYSVSTTYKKLNTAIFELKRKFNPDAFKEVNDILYSE